MTLVLDPTTEARLQRELATGRYTGPSELLTHALDLLEAERDSTEATSHAMEDWLLRNKDAIQAGLQESLAAKERGESYSPEEAMAMLAERRAARIQKAA
jgi:Arc/MetJ-type ribon-helix-helix transcriptional regulator